MAKPVLVLHIGLPKTGSTAAQEFLYANRELLKTQKIYYPNTGIIDGAHHLLATSLLKRVPPALQKLPRPNSQAIYRDLINNFNHSGCNTMLLSTEYFSLFGFPYQKHGREFIADFFRDFDIRILAYLRHQLPRYESTYSQEVRNAKLSQPVYHQEFFQDFISRKGNYYTFLIDQWAETFGKSGLIIRPFVRSLLHKRNIIYDVLDQINAPLDATWKFPMHEANQALSYYRIDLLNKLTTLSLPRDVKDSSYDAISSLPLLDCERVKTTILSDKERALLITQFEEDNQKLNLKYKDALKGLTLDAQQLDKTPKYHEGLDHIFLHQFADKFSDKHNDLGRELSTLILSQCKQDDMLKSFADQLNKL